MGCRVLCQSSDDGIFSDHTPQVPMVAQVPLNQDPHKALTSTIKSDIPDSLGASTQVELGLKYCCWLSLSAVGLQVGGRGLHNLADLIPGSGFRV